MSDLSRKNAFNAAPPENIEKLVSELRIRIKGEVRFDAPSRALYSTDASNYRQVPIGVVLPKDREDVIAAVKLCSEYNVPVLSRGAGTSCAGQCCNAAVVLDMSKYMNRILEIDHVRMTAKVEPGLVLDRLQEKARGYGLVFGPDPATHSRCTLGGMIGNNSCGVHSISAGKTSENVEELEILTYDGDVMRVGAGDIPSADAAGADAKAGIYKKLRALAEKNAELIRRRYPDISRRVSGYNLDELLPEKGFHVARSLVGTEGTCVTVLSATVKLMRLPQKTVLLVLGFKDIFEAADSVPLIMDHGPSGLEGMDGNLIDHTRRKGGREENLRLLPDGDGWLMAEFGGASQEEAVKKAEKLIEALVSGEIAARPALLISEADQRKIWAIRESAVGVTAFVPGEPDTFPGWEDSAVHPRDLGKYLRDLRALMEAGGYQGAFYGHFGEGCVHTRINFDFKTPDGIARFKNFMDNASDLVVRYGGSISGEHGDGQARAELIHKTFGPELIGAFIEFKRIWDPRGMMNPGKVVNAHSMTENLRLQTPVKMKGEKTHFAYTEEGDFLHAMERCIGVGKCRREGAETMCPSYMVTKEEKHSTRGRARLLYEMLAGEVLKDGWREEGVKEALDLCLACKGCKSECPVHVDMATYKAEFLFHYYKGRSRPLAAYAFGWLHKWVRIAQRMTGAVNFFLRAPGFQHLGKKILGIAPARSFPEFAARPFTKTFRMKNEKGKKEVLLWPDTFNNYFQPHILSAAAEFLEYAGYSVRIPKAFLCCGRPLYDFGMLPEAKRLLQKVMISLSAEIAAGIPIVGLEPGCVSVFRDELQNQFPDDPAAAKLKTQFFTLSEFLLLSETVFPKLERKAVVHGHCHHKSVMGMSADLKVYKKLGLDFELIDSGCCGMAGAFGYQADHYEVSVKAAERVLLPRLRETPDDTLILSDGFSCREQIRQLAEKKSLHLAEVLLMAAGLSRS